MPRSGDDWMTPRPAPDGEQVADTALVGGVSGLAHDVRDLRDSVEKDRRERRRTAIGRYAVIVAALIVALALFGVTRSTNRAVRQEVPGLQKQIADRDATIAQQNDIIEQVPPIIIDLSKRIKELGGTPPEIVLRPRNTTTTTADN